MRQMTDILAGMFLKLCILPIIAALMTLPSYEAVAASSSSVYHDSSMDFGSIKTVAVMPLVNLTRDQQSSDRVRDVFVTTLMANSEIYVVPSGEVARGIISAGIANPAAPTPEEVIRLCKTIKVDSVFTGVLREYGEVRSGTAMANAISLSMQLMEGQTGKIVWSADTTQGGIGVMDRLFGGGGQPLNVVTEEAVDEIIKELFK